ncbi:MAG: isochorismate synthase [Polyangiaceae bacterium]|nr:isochorismate synthase [Polyangiaceae bacterium]
MEKRSAPCSTSDEPRCYGGVSFDRAGPSEVWVGFGSGSFVLPRFLYEQHGGHAWLRLHVLPGEPLLPMLDALQQARRSLFDLPPRASVQPAGPFHLTEDTEGYRRVVLAALSAIAEGVLEKVVVARYLLLEGGPIDPWSVLDRLEGEPMVRFAFGRGNQVFLGATPERLVSLDGRYVATEALAGSIQAAPGASSSLLASNKDRREHQVVVEAILQALAPFCIHLDAPHAPEVRPLRHLLHLRTPIKGEAKEALHVLDLVGALHPTPAVCGLPREVAAAWLRENEGLERGWYAAPVGWFDAQGRGTFAVALRSALLQGSSARIFVGAGVVQGSTPDGELYETSLKARSLLDALGI